MLMQDMLTGYLHEVPDSQLYEYNEVLYDGLGNPVGIAPLIMAALPALMPMLSNLLNPSAPPATAIPPPPVQALPPAMLPPVELPRPPEPSFQPPMPPPYPMSPVPGEFPMRPMPDGFPLGPNGQPGIPGPGHPFAGRRYRPRLRRRKKEMTNASSRPFYR